MDLRPIETKDIDNMIEWMRDEQININFKKNFSILKKEDLLEFVNNSFTEKDKNYAIVNDHDEYLGTISLKNIDNENMNAEYAIVLRSKAIGTGIAQSATNRLLDIAFDEMKLRKVYLNVYKDNKRAIKFYEKMGFTFEGEFRDHVRIDDTFKTLKWFSILNPSELSYIA